MLDLNMYLVFDGKHYISSSGINEKISRANFFKQEKTAVKAIKSLMQLEPTHKYFIEQVSLTPALVSSHENVFCLANDNVAICSKTHLYRLDKIFNERYAEVWSKRSYPEKYLLQLQALFGNIGLNTYRDICNLLYEWGPDRAEYCLREFQENLKSIRVVEMAIRTII